MFHCMDYLELKAPGKSVTSRVAAVLRAVAFAPEDGGRLLDITQAAKLPQPTVHRILGELVDEGFVRRLPHKKYALGAGLSVLSSVSPSLIKSLDGIRQVAEELATKLGDSVYVGMRTGDTVRYLVRATGSFPIHAFPVEEGTQLPLGVTNAGISLIPYMPNEARQRVLQPKFLLRRRQGDSPEDMDIVKETIKVVESVEHNGYFFAVDLMATDTAGIAVPIPSPSGLPPYMALSITAISSRFPEKRVSEVVPVLRSAATRMSEFIE